MINPAIHNQGITLRKAALIAGFGLLIMAIAGPLGRVVAHGRLIVPADIEETVRNIAAHKRRFAAGILGYLTMFICDVVVAWALYILLAPVNRSLSLLAAIFRTVYAVIALTALAKLVTILRVLSMSEYLTAYGPEVHWQIRLLLNSFNYQFEFGLLLFGFYLLLLGYLVYRSGYIPRIMGILLAISGLGWVIDSLRPFLYPNAHLDFIMITVIGELIFMGWLLVRGRKIPEPAAKKRDGN